MTLFPSRYMSFFAGSILAVLVILTVVDEDFLAVKNIIGVMTVTGLIVTVCRSCIPDEVCPQPMLDHSTLLVTLNRFSLGCVTSQRR